MATLLAGTTFNGVRVWGGSSSYAITNTIVGAYAGDALGSASADNTFFGLGAGRDAQNAYGNSVIGVRNFRAFGGPTPQPLSFNVVGGYAAMGSADAANKNTAIGTYAGFHMNNAESNVAIGHRSFGINGKYNTFVGYYSGKGSGTGNSNFNIGIGKYALTSVGNGGSNTAIGMMSLCNLGNGNGNIAIGSRSGGNINNANETIAIGFGSTTSDNNGHTVAGNSYMSYFRVGAGSWTNLSDRRDKSDIEPLDDNLGLNFIRNLRPVKFKFDFRDNYVNKCGFEYGTKDGTLKQDFESYGFIAQEMETTLNNIQTHFDSLNRNSDGNYRLEYESLISPIVKSLQQTIERLEFLESKV